MRILHLSDTHGCHRRVCELPFADIVVHSGDFTMNGSEAEAIDGIHDDCLNSTNIHKVCTFE